MGSLMARYCQLNGVLKMRLRASCEAGFYAEKLKPFPNLLEPGAFLHFQFARIQRRRHHGEHQVGTMFFLLVKRLGERDVAVKMPLVKFIE